MLHGIDCHWWINMSRQCFVTGPPSITYAAMANYGLPQPTTGVCTWVTFGRLVYILEAKYLRNCGG